MSRELAKKALDSAETLYLVENGWKLVTNGGWTAPHPFASDVVTQDVAVNTQKMWDKNQNVPQEVTA